MCCSEIDGAGSSSDVPEVTEEKLGGTRMITVGTWHGFVKKRCFGTNVWHVPPYEYISRFCNGHDIQFTFRIVKENLEGRTE